jgi:hypothetical protein
MYLTLWLNTGVGGLASTGFIVVSQKIGSLVAGEKGLAIGAG